MEIRPNVNKVETAKLEAQQKTKEKQAKVKEFQNSVFEGASLQKDVEKNDFSVPEKGLKVINTKPEPQGEGILKTINNNTKPEPQGEGILKTINNNTKPEP